MFPPHSPHGFATHLPARRKQSPATLANKEITPCVAKETFHDSYLAGAACLQGILRFSTGYCRLVRRTALWDCLGAGF